MNPHRTAQTRTCQRLDLLHWLLFAIALIGAYVVGPPAALADDNTLSSQHDLQAVESADETGPTHPESSGVIREAAESSEPSATPPDETTPGTGSEESARVWSDDDSDREAYAEHLIGTWRIDLTQFMTRQLAENGRPGLAMIAGALTQELFGESYGIVTANADGSGSARGLWLGETVNGEGSWEVLAVDGEHAQVRLVVPEYGVDQVFDIHREGDRVYAHYQRLPAIFVRQGSVE